MAKIDPQSILIILHGSIGDVTRALPLANLVRRGFPNAHLAWAVEPPSLPLVEHYPGLDEIIVFNRPKWWAGIMPFLRKIRSRRFDLVLDLQRHFKSGLISFLSGAPQRVGFNRRDTKEFNWFFNNQFIPAAQEEISKLAHYLKFAEFLGIDTHPVEWHLDLTPQEQMAVDRHLAQLSRPHAVLFVGSRWESKRWFPDQVAQCALMIQERYHLEVVLLGSKDDEGLALEAQQHGNVSVVNLVGQTSLREAIGIVARARVAVGPDTGLMHIADAVGTPVVSLWGATSPRRTGPHDFADLIVQGKASCAPCYLRRCSIGRICMRSIDQQEIAEKIYLALARGSVKGMSHGGRA